ncbi:MAG: ribonuclease HII [Patescibacteria group bacterium]|nr:ribonuclease HII [Patescibacteria group bacterium]NCU39292.1 ribonuclease HII [Candidatus Falkowbacteria bacterium]
MLDLNTERKIINNGYPLIGGIDEAGRGPLAGPVVAACVVIDANFNIDNNDLALVADSKTLSPAKRNALFKIIKDNVLAVEIGVVDNDIIDKINILQASFLAMRRSLKKIPLKPDFILVDGKLPIPRITTPQKAIVGGDSNTWVIAAASIIAKVSRDWLMTEFHKKYPEYNFEKHKGYGTKEHMRALLKFGPCPIHRLSFAPLKKD